MTTSEQPSPERQMAAAQVAQMFNSVHQFINSIKQVDPDGNPIMSEHLRNCHARLDEAGHWAVRHVLTYGVPPAPPPAAAAEPEVVVPAPTV